MNYYKNNAFSVLASAATSIDTTLTLATGTGSRFPAANFLVTLIGYDGSGNENAWEIMRCTSRSGDILTVVRAQEGTTATAWPSAARIENRVTAAAMEAVQADINELDAKKANLASPNFTGNVVAQSSPASVGISALAGSNSGYESKSQGNGIDAGAATIAFHRPSTHAVHFGLDTDNKLKVGGWSMGANAYAIYHENNKPTKADVGLGNVDNTSDAAKIVASAGKLTTARTINGVSFDGSANISINAAAVPNTPAGSIAATTLQAAINELDAEKVSNVAVLPSTTNLDTVVTSGFYRMNAVSNGPGVSVDYGQLIVSRGEDTITQIAVDYSSGRMFTRSGAPTSIGGPGAFTNWREVYTSASILGTVSQSAGVPTGAVIERGSNANGEYVRFADGTQYCTWRSPDSALPAVSLLVNQIYKSEGVDILWSFPAAFSAEPAVSGTVVAGIGNAWIGAPESGLNSATSCQFRLYAATSQSGGAIVQMIAIGRWF